MPRISHEEYEVLKELDDKWKWIARDKDKTLWAYTEIPVRKKGVEFLSYWDTEAEKLYSTLDLYDERFLFQFIQWRDEPYNTAELIKEYESSQMTYFDRKLISEYEWLTKESEETKVKSKQELIDRWESAIEAAEFYGKGKEDRLIEYMRDFVDDLNQLDEPEVLSDEWIDEHAEHHEYIGYAGVPVDDLQNLLVPKQELPVIPKFVADWYEEHKGNLEKQLQGIAFNLDKYGEMPEVNDLDKWMNETESPLQTLASLKFGYTVETEQKYYVMNNDNRMMLVRMMDGKTITEADPFKLEDMYEVEKKSHRLTEQEIKDYDPRYWVFAEPVEEAEFRLTF